MPTPRPLDPDLTALRERLRSSVEHLAGSIGPRNVFRPATLERTAQWLDTQLQAMGLDTWRQEYVAAGNLVDNLVADTGPEEGELLVVGAHYDTVRGCPGANDNGSGCAALLEVARRLVRERPARRVMLAFFVNEEPPFFRTAEMGSRRLAALLAEAGHEVAGMISLETIGYYSSEEGSQSYPLPLSPFYPSTGDFIGMVGNLGSRGLLRRLEEAFRRAAEVPVVSASLPGLIPGVGWSDHSSFWRHGWPAVMVTDTAPYRYPWYHTPDDTPDRLDWDGMTRVVAGLVEAVVELAG